MREIKFRTWVKSESKMIFGRFAMAIDIFTQGFAYRSKEVELMQYTGLKDKNGKEIYEGDLYKYTISHDMYNPESGHTTLEVEHVKAVTFENGAYYHGTHLLSEVVEYDDTFTYVGNIYENPELLEELQNESK